MLTEKKMKLKITMEGYLIIRNRLNINQIRTEL
jgi:hypothetical protein